MIGFGKHDEHVIAFADELAGRGHQTLAKDIKVLVARRRESFFQEGVGKNERRWLNETILDGEPIAVHWRRHLDRRRQAERRQHRSEQLTRIEIETRLKEELEALKAPGETWSNLLRRLAAQLRPALTCAERER